MKKYTLFYILASFAFCGCKQGNNPEEHSSKDAKTSQESVSGNAEKTKAKVNKIHRNIPIGTDFTHLICVSGADVVFTQGDYKLEAYGDSAILTYLETDFDSNILTISLASERNQDLNIYEGKVDVTINLSAPDLRCVSLCSSGDFISKGLWKGEKIEFGMIGKGQFKCDSIDCSTFDFQSSGNGSADFTHIKAQTIHFANMSNCNVTADINTQILQCENKGNNTMTFTGHAKDQQLYPTKTGKILFK